METLEEMQARHRKEKKDLQGRITNKKKNATKKTRKGVNDECAELERQLASKQAAELASLSGDVDEESEPSGDDNVEGTAEREEEVILEEKMKKVRFEDVPPAKERQPAQQTQQEQQGPKKRNRQRERLARRAAEQLAAAEAAESEAANMVDHRGIERAAMEGTFKANSLVEKEIRPDGHCLFSAVADQLEQRGVPLLPATTGEKRAGEEGKAAAPGYKAVRAVAAGWIEDHADDFAPFLEEDLEGYVRKMRDTAEWGGQVELLALANAYNVQINVVQNGATERIRPSEGRDGEKQPVEIWLAYYRHGYGLGEHYNSLRKAP